MEATASCFTETLAISQTINIHNPKGGVIFPIIKAKLDTTPKRIGSIPTLFTTGIKRGIKIMIRADGFKKHPPIRKATTISDRMIVGSVETEVNDFVK